MKKLLLFILLCVLVPCVVIACGGENGNNGDASEKTREETSVSTEPNETAEETKTEETEETETKAPETEKEAFKFDPDDYTFVQKFEAPTGDRRTIAMDYMMEMATIEWTPAEDFRVNWRNEGSFKVDMPYSKDKLYTGMPYSRSGCSLEFFEQYLTDGVFKDRSYYYEEMIGNNCSQCMYLAYQQLVDIPVAGLMKPNNTRAGILMFPLDENGKEILTKPDYEKYGDKWYTQEVFECNTKENVFKAYAALEKGDILYKSINGTGHTRMVDHVELKKALSGAVNYAQSSVVCLEQTNQFDKERPGINSTWYMHHKYSFSDLYDTLFMPVTLCTFHDEKPLEDAYVLFKSTDNSENILQGTDGVVESNFPLNYVKLTLTDKNGKVVSVSSDYGFDNAYKYQLKSLHYDLFKDVPAGTYTFTARAGIARGGCDLESFEVTVG